MTYRFFPASKGDKFVDIPDEALTELVLCFRPAQHILTDAGVDASKTATGVLGALFPPSVPVYPFIDHI